MERLSALVLAGRRGASDELAEARGASHRALLSVGGAPMLVRVVDTLHRMPELGHIAVSIEEPDLLADQPELAKLMERGALSARASRSSPSRSVLDALDDPALGAPLLVTTADHPLLTPEMVRELLAGDSDADLLVGAVAASLLRARYPESHRTYLPLAGEKWSGANLFAFRTCAARRAAEFWVRAEHFRKQPWRLVSSFGATTLALFLLRRLDLDAAMQRVSRAMGVRVRAVSLPFAEAAIDVDRAADLELAERILAHR